MECPLCEYKTVKYVCFRKHLRIYHPNVSNALLICKFKRCQREYNLKDSFLRHVKNAHFSNSSPETSFTSIDSYPSEAQLESSKEDYNITFDDGGRNGNKFKMDQFLEMLYKKMHLTNADIDHILSSLKDLCPDLQKVDTLWKRINYFKNSNVYIEPKAVVVGITKRGKPDSIQYVSLIETMEKIFSNQTFFKECKNYMSMKPENPTIIGDFKDGSTFQGSVETGQLTFPFVVYYDDFESGNPLGSKKGVHKIGAVYMSLRCCDPVYYSKLNSIYLVMLMLTKQREKYSNGNIFENLIHDINHLEKEGILVGNDRIKFKFIGFNGDNLGLHSLLGFTESFTGEFCCRFCKIRRKDMIKCCYLDESLIRSPDNYTIGREGVRSKCAFNEIESFHCTTNYVVDVMHDLYNGVGNYVLTKVLIYYVKHKYFSIELLNERIAELDLKSIKKPNRPTSIKEQNLLKGTMSLSCSEMKILIYYIPVLLGDFIPEGCQHWRLVLLLRDIALISSSKKICTSSLDYLDGVISELNQIYINIFKDSLKPKFHFLLHYKNMILKSGPMSHLWSFRFEAKHQSLKEYANVCKSRVDICMSIAKRIQLTMAASLNCEINLNVSPCLSMKTSENIYNMLDFRGITYKVGNVILVSYNDNYPIFGEISKFSSSNNSVIIETWLYKTLDYNHHLDSFLIESSETAFKLTLPGSLREPVLKYSFDNYHYYVIYNRYEYD